MNHDKIVCKIVFKKSYFYELKKASCQLWESEKARVDKRIFVKVTTAIRKDMERISRLFQKLEKTKIQFGFQITFVSSNLPKLFENRS